NLRAEQSRVEALPPGSFDVVASRAFASLADFAALTRHQRRPAGKWMAMKGKSPTAEFALLPRWARVFHVEQLQVPGLAAERCLVWIDEQT
ncbi:MAG: RsmG family class I SAM-dependent methyltransferase, partial [Caldimonas sp.]